MRPKPTPSRTVSAPARRRGAPAAAGRAQFHADVAELRARLAAAADAASDAAGIIIGGLEEILQQGDAARERGFDALGACAFHDIVGQHLARAGELLDLIESLGPQGTDSHLRPARDLLHGPRLAGEPDLDQAAIDAFFNG
jgi:hypothetical protein